MIYKINGKVYTKKEFVKNMKSDLAREYLFTHDILSDHLKVDIASLSQKEIEKQTNLFIDQHLDQMLDFISIEKRTDQVFNDRLYTIDR